MRLKNNVLKWHTQLKILVLLIFVYFVLIFITLHTNVFRHFQFNHNERKAFKKLAVTFQCYQNY